MTTVTNEPPPAAEPGVDPFFLAGRTFRSRLIVGTGKYKDFATMRAALDASGAEVVTVAVRRERLYNDKGQSLLEFIDRFSLGESGRDKAADPMGRNAKRAVAGAQF